MIDAAVGVGGNVVESEALLEPASGSGRDRRLARKALQWSGAMLTFVRVAGRPAGRIGGV